MVLTEMINLAAEIAEQLLVAKDNDSDGLLPRTKLDIIRLAELAATMPDLPEEEAAEEAAEEPDEEPAPDPAEEPVEEPAEETVEELVEEPEEEPRPEEEPLPAPAAEAAAPTGLVAAQLRRMFSLNDLFLFRRELFQGSQVLFDNALEEVGTCSSATQAREILVNNYALDPRRPEAKEFIGVISGLFEI